MTFLLQQRATCSDTFVVQYCSTCPCGFAVRLKHLLWTRPCVFAFGLTFFLQQIATNYDIFVVYYYYSTYPCVFAFAFSFAFCPFVILCTLVCHYLFKYYYVFYVILHSLCLSWGRVFTRNCRLLCIVSLNGGLKTLLLLFIFMPTTSSHLH